MDGARFDSLTLALTAARSRRELTRTLSGLVIGGAAGTTWITEATAKKKKKKACPPCKKRKKGKCKKNRPDGADCPGGNCQDGKCVPFTPCQDGRAVCSNGVCCSPDKDCIEGAFGEFICACPEGTSGCASDFCMDVDGCAGPVNLEACTCDGACQDGRGLCGGECCPPTQVCQAGACACPSGTIECQPGSCASVACSNGQSRNPMTCVCPE